METWLYLKLRNAQLDDNQNFNRSLPLRNAASSNIIIDYCLPKNQKQTIIRKRKTHRGTYLWTYSSHPAVDPSRLFSAWFFFPFLQCSKLKRFVAPHGAESLCIKRQPNRTRHAADGTKTNILETVATAVQAIRLRGDAGWIESHTVSKSHEKSRPGSHSLETRLALALRMVWWKTNNGASRGKWTKLWHHYLWGCFAD